MIVGTIVGMDYHHSNPAQAQETGSDDSVAWKINRECVTLLGWGTAMLMEFAHPLVAAGVTDHSVTVSHPEVRLHRLWRTIEAMLALTFGLPDQAVRAARGINAIHDRVNGRLEESVGAFPAGTPYSAHDPSLLLWVHATLLYALPRVYELYVGPLTDEEKDRFCAEGAYMSHVVGIPEEDMPTSMAALDAYLGRMLGSGEIAVGTQGRFLAREMFAPPRGPLIYLPTVGLLPPALREAYGLRWNAGYEAALRLSASAVRRALPLTPPTLRYWPLARVAMRRREPARMHTPHAPKLTAAHLQAIRRRPQPDQGQGAAR